MRISGTLVAAGDGRVDVRARADRPGPTDDRRRGRRRQLGADRAERRVHGLRERGGHRRRSISSPASAHELEVEYVLAGPSMGALAIGCTPPAPPDLLERAVALAARADVVVCVVGTDGDWETEGNDRESMALPPPQDDLVRAVAAVNPRTVVVVNAASPVDMDWADDVERGAAVLVRGRGVGPRAGRRALRRRHARRASCRRPSRFASRTRPRSRAIRASAAQVRYGEGVFVGYRWYDARRIEPRFCFGHGLSYTTFALDPPLRVDRRRSARRRAARRRARPHRRPRAQHRERGAAPRSCSATCTTSHASVARPPAGAEGVRQGVARSASAAGEATLELDRRAFAFWDVDADDWVVEPGEFELRIGTSSRAIAHRVTITRGRVSAAARRATERTARRRSVTVPVLRRVIQNGRAGERRVAVARCRLRRPRPARCDRTPPTSARTPHDRRRASSGELDVVLRVGFTM